MEGPIALAIESELLDQPLAAREPNEVCARDGLLANLKKALLEFILKGELDEHRDGECGEGSSNCRNRTSQKSVLSGTSKMTLSMGPRLVRYLRSESEPPNTSAGFPISTTRSCRCVRAA